MACDWSLCTVSEPSPRVVCDSSPVHSFHLACYPQAVSAALMAPLCRCAILTCSGHIEGTSGFLFGSTNNDAPAELTFGTTIADLRAPQAVPAPTGEQYDDADAYPDQSGEGEQAQPAEPVPDCAVCLTPVLATEEHRYCTGCTPRKYVHEDPACLGNENCYACRTALVSPTASAAATPVAWKTDVTSTLWDLKRAVPQGVNATMCYAAATATAIRCVDTGSAITVADCMHLYAISGGTEDDWADGYKRSFDEAEAALKAGGNASPTVTQVHQKMESDPRWTTDLESADCWGSPVFPSGTNVEGPYSLELDHIIGYVQTAKLILAGSFNHWNVIWGCKVRDRDDKAYLKIYDPMGDGRTDESYLWDDDEFDQYLVVG